MSIAILMSTYNGGAFLREQIDSIIAQDSDNWQLYIRDDGSSDDTVQIIADYAQKYENVRIVPGGGNMGAALSFLHLLKVIEADYYMFCDQDDVWLSNKVSKSYDFFIQNFGKSSEIPGLVFSDARVVDQKLQTINESFWRMTRALPSYLEHNKQFIKVFNCAPGCTMFFNKKLKNRCSDYRQGVFMHDWYIMLMTMQFGELRALPEPLLLYRQHTANVFGASGTTYKTMLSKVFLLKKTILDQRKIINFVREYSGASLVGYYWLKAVFNIKRFRNR